MKVDPNIYISTNLEDSKEDLELVAVLFKLRGVLAQHALSGTLLIFENTLRILSTCAQS